jgi:hypothetical protein
LGLTARSDEDYVAHVLPLTSSARWCAVKVFAASAALFISPGIGGLLGRTPDWIQNAAATVLTQIATRAVVAFNIEASSARPFPFDTES